MGVQAAAVKVHVLKADRVAPHPHKTYIELSIGSSKIKTEPSHNNIWGDMYSIPCPSGEQSKLELVLKLKSLFKSQTLGKFKTPLRKLMTQGVEAPYPLLDDGGRPAGMLVMRMWVSEQREVPNSTESPLRRQRSTKSDRNADGDGTSSRVIPDSPMGSRRADKPKTSFTSIASPGARRRAKSNAPAFTSPQPKRASLMLEPDDGNTTVSDGEESEGEDYDAFKTNAHINTNSDDSFRGKVMARARSISRSGKGAKPPTILPPAPIKAPEDALSPNSKTATNAEMEELRISREKLQRRCQELETIIMSPLTSFAPVDLKEKEPRRTLNETKFTQPAPVTMNMPPPDGLTATFAPGFSQSICGCLREGTVSSCLMSFFFPCIVSAETQAEVEERECTFNDCLCYSAYLTRQSVRARHNMGYSACADCCCAFFCNPCVVSQTQRENTARIKLNTQYNFGDAYGNKRAQD